MSSYPGLGLGLVLDEYINLSTVGTVSTLPARMESERRWRPEYLYLID